MKKILYFSAIGSRVDYEKKIIYGASLCSIGEAKGHGFEIDKEFLTQLLAAAKDEMPVYATHHHQNPDGTTNPERLYTKVGVVKNIRLAENKVIGDVYLYSSFEKTNLILEMADLTPAEIGLSIEFAAQVDNGSLVMRGKCLNVEEFTGVAFTEDPAANPNGLFSTKKSNSTNNYMNDKGKGIKLGALKLKDIGDVFFDGEMIAKDAVIYTDAEMTTPVAAGTYLNEETGLMLVVNESGAVTDFLENETDEVMLAKMAEAEKVKAESEMAAKVEVLAAKKAAEIIALQSKNGSLTEVELLKKELELEKARNELNQKISLSQKINSIKVREVKTNVGIGLSIPKGDGTFEFGSLLKDSKQSWSQLVKKNDIKGLAKEYLAFKSLRHEDEKRPYFEKQFRQENGVRNLSSGVVFEADITTRALGIFNEFSKELLMGSDIFQHFRIIGSAEILAIKNGLIFNFQLPTLRNSSMAIQAAQLCNPTRTQKVAVGAETMPVAKNGLYTAFCPAEWQDVLQSAFYVNDQAMPLEFVILDFLMEIAMTQSSQNLLHGTVPINGLYQQTVAYAAPAANNVVIPNWTVANVITNIDLLVNALPIELRNETLKGRLRGKIIVPLSVMALYRDAIKALNNFYYDGYNASTATYARTSWGDYDFIFAENMDAVTLGVNTSVAMAGASNNLFASFTYDTAVASPLVYWNPSTRLVEYNLEFYAGVGASMPEYLAYSTLV